MSRKTLDQYRLRFGELFFAVDAAYFKLYKQEGIGRREAELVWRMLNADEPVTQAYLCKVMALPKQSVHSLVMQEREKGYLAFTQSEDDGRVRVITMTEEGKARYGEQAKKIREVEKKTFSKLSQEEREQLIRSLEVFLDAFEDEIGK